MYRVDATGLSCPEPVILLKKALAGNNEVLLSVDNKTAAENCSRFAESKGFFVKVNATGKSYELTVTKA